MDATKTGNASSQQKSLVALNIYGSYVACEVSTKQLDTGISFYYPGLVFTKNLKLSLRPKLKP